MNRLCAALTLVLLGFTIVARTTEGQSATQTNESQVIDDLQAINTLVAQLKERVIDKNGEESRLLNHTAGSVNTLIKLGKGKTAPRGYIYSIELDHSLLKTYETRRDIQLLKVPSSDLDTKASYAEDNPAEPFKEIRVKASTKNSLGQVQHGYRVWSALTGELSSGFTIFTSQSSPAIRFLVAGDYFIYATRAEIRTEPKKYPIGENTKPGNDGHREEDIDVDVP